MTSSKYNRGNGEKNPVARLTNASARQLRLYREGGFSIADLARLFCVSESTARYCVHGLTYQEAGGPIEPSGSRKFNQSVIPRA